MTPDEEPQFRACYHRLCAAYQKKRDVNEYGVYLEAVRPLAIAAIEAACLELCRQTTVPGKSYFPKAPEIFVRAVRYQSGLIEHALEQRRRLRPDADQIAREMPGIEAAHLAAIEELKDAGHIRGAAMLAAVTPRHPLEYSAPVSIHRENVARRATTRELYDGRISGEFTPLLSK